MQFACKKDAISKNIAKLPRAFACPHKSLCTFLWPTAQQKARISAGCGFVHKRWQSLQQDECFKPQLAECDTSTWVCVKIGGDPHLIGFFSVSQSMRLEKGTNNNTHLENGWIFLDLSNFEDQFLLFDRNMGLQTITCHGYFLKHSNSTKISMWWSVECQIVEPGHNWMSRS